MKKTLVSALTTALVVGAASTTFAAANPFSDVPADHWAYDAVSQLAADGVIEGYGDSTFKGNRNITRYEMAQMVAKAMAKNTSGADKALVDKLAAEFAEELNNLGVRVAKLERNADMVKWNGKAEYTWQRSTRENTKDGSDTNKLLFRLEPSAEVNDHWHVNARLDANAYMNDDTSTDVKLKRVWAQGDYKNFQVRAGKMGNNIANDIVFDDPFSGLDVTFGSNLKATLAYGRVDSDTASSNRLGKKSDWEYTAANTRTKRDVDAFTYWGLGLNFDAGQKLTARAGFQHFSGTNVKTYTHAINTNTTTTTATKVDSTNVWSVGAGYKFDKNFALDATYARANSGDEKTAFSYQVSYKGAQPANKGTWGAWAAYRYLGDRAAFHPTWDVINSNQKGWELGVKYVPFKNIVTQLQYGNGSYIREQGNGKKYNSIFGRIEFFF